PGVTTIEALADFLGVDPAATAKAMPAMVGERPVRALLRGDDRPSAEELATARGEAYRPMTEEEIRAVFGAGGGSLGPVAVTIDVRAATPPPTGRSVRGGTESGRTRA